jgi:hypothetical protein
VEPPLGQGVPTDQALNAPQRHQFVLRINQH